MLEKETPQISTVLLSWNRYYLLKETIDSYLDTISVPFEMIIVDNGSDDGSQEFIKRICQEYSNCSSILLSENKGGAALNLGLQEAKADFLHVSENDLIYKPDWDQKMLKAFEKFPRLGQLSLYSPFPQKELGETCDVRSAYKIIRDDCAIYVTDINIGTSSMFRRSIWDRGVRWRNTKFGTYKFPHDSAFSKDVMKCGYLVAWNDEYLVINCGHQVDELRENLAYYIKNYKSKWRGFKKFKERLRRFGYRLERARNTESGYKIVPIDE
ncbi:MULTISPECIES: glycosyltransferase family 2 protein [unclassified Candidatus Frackibacter]|uniref:glycosyltransferase family 2 protein n=1 Tax=unclassified Candidatus Frackibacter TaxID=2648818 RepID=UPI00088563E6|nr:MULTISPECIES: glycosyltransferase family 2 protein [unclassified Candidatus Frackibacter]SDC82670.1 Glycosyltransferase involved in cell wall bisynthesis [Candidatus Frackibacter sp. WG11]SEM97135.1 Glycosyltransferase involved in cell wall bisynthesis [Candidatus Frackibacter sp. WG12]SFM05780.1 Glycosyltransferase involved in cell wall bisynthesis [Candidatus Frackibacter sp. WG13]